MAPRGRDAERHVRPSSPPSTAEAPQGGVAALCPPSLPPGSHAVPPRGVLVVPRMRPDPPVSPSHTLPSRLPSLPTPHVLILPISVPQLSPQVTPITWPKTPRFCPAADAWSVPTPVMRAMAWGCPSPAPDCELHWVWQVHHCAPEHGPSAW